MCVFHISWRLDKWELRDGDSKPGGPGDNERGERREGERGRERERELARA